MRQEQRRNGPMSDTSTDNKSISYHNRVGLEQHAMGQPNEDDRFMTVLCETQYV